jgi:Zn-dependent protease
LLRQRKFILGLLWLVPVLYGLAAVSLPFSIYRMISYPNDGFDQTADKGPAYQVLFFAIRALLILLSVTPIAICVTSTATILQYHRRKLNARSWAIACGASFTAGAVPILVGGAVVIHYAGLTYDDFLSFGLFGAIHLAIGIWIAAAFLPRSSISDLYSREAHPSKVKGDGTTSLSHLFTIAVVVAGFWVVDSQVRRWGQEHNLPRTSGFLIDQLIFFSALIIAIALHELGHIAAGWSVGMKLLSIRVSLLHAKIKEGQWRLIPPASWKSLFQGGVEIIPTSPQAYRKSHAIWTGAGGPLASLVGGGLAVLALLAIKGSVYEPVWQLLGYIAATCLIFFLANLVPAREAYAYSDGARIFQILTGNVMENCRRVVAVTQATTFTGLRPRDFDISLIEETASNGALELHDRAFLHLVASDHYFDHDTMDEACMAFSKAEAAASEMKSVWKETCGAFVLRAVCIANNKEMAEKWWENRLHAKSFDTKNDSEFAFLAYCLIENRLVEAEEAFKRQSERTGRLPDTGERAFDLHYLGRLRELLDNAPARRCESSPASTIQHSGLDGAYGTLSEDR